MTTFRQADRLLLLEQWDQPWLHFIRLRFPWWKQLAREERPWGQAGGRLCSDPDSVLPVPAVALDQFLQMWKWKWPWPPSTGPYPHDLSPRSLGKVLSSLGQLVFSKDDCPLWFDVSSILTSGDKAVGISSLASHLCFSSQSFYAVTPQPWDLKAFLIPPFKWQAHH